MSDAQPVKQYDAIIIGAGVTGLYQLYRLRELGLSVRIYEAASGVGGTWFWNRYPGCRFDSESASYGYSFSEELLREWNWTEKFSPQPDTLHYLNFVADKFDLRKDITFNSRVGAASFDETANEWRIETENGERARARFLITALGPLSAPIMPDIPGMDDFKGLSFHTFNWPADPDGWGGKDIGYAGKRVGIIGTGATGVQVIQEVAKTAGHLTVFQRRPNWCSPLGNSLITEEEQAQIKASYPEIFKKCKTSFAGMVHDSDPRSALDVSAEEREALFEKLYYGPGFSLWLGAFADIFTDRKANDLISEFVAKKIRQRVKDPKIAEKLIPKEHGFGTRRVPLETKYYEVYNQPNVTLVDISETPIERITPSGIKTGGQEYELDILIYATGFDAVTGALTRIDITGEDGVKLKDKWANGPRSYLGLQSAGFPNLFTLVGPQGNSALCNVPRCAELNVEWVTDFIRHMRDTQMTRAQPAKAAEDAWVDEVAEAAAATLLDKTDSWYTGSNVPGKKRTFLIWAGGNVAYREKLADVAAKDYAGFEIR
ncbi:MAG: flavin-containing monooxygenase [Alphaproteobacteria bacterium]